MCYWEEGECMGFLINASRNKKKQKILFAIVAIFLAVGLVGSTMLGVFAGDPSGDYVDSPYVPQTTEEEIAELEVKLEEEPENVDTLGRLAHAYYKNNQFDKSIATYEKALEMEPSNSYLRTSLAAAYFMSDDFDNAVAQMEEEISNNPDNYTAYYYLGQYLAYGQGNYERAIEELQAFVDAAGDMELMSFEVDRAKQMIEEFKTH